MMKREPDSQAVLSMMAQHPYFQPLAPDQRQALAQQARVYTFPTETIIFGEGEPAAGMWLIAQGNVKVYKLNADGQEHILHLLGPGNSFNDIPAVDGRSNPANAATLSPVTAWLLPCAAIRTLMHQDITFAMGIIDRLTQRVRTLTHQIEELTLYATTARLARFLLQQAENPALAGAGITRKAIAAYLATTPETVSRTLRSLQDMGAIRFDRHRIMIIDGNLLRTIAALTPDTQ